MGKLVTTPFAGISITSDATQDLFSLLAGSNNRLALVAFEITSDAVAATLMAITLKRITAVGSGGAVATEALLDAGNSTITGSVRTGDTTPGASGASLEAYQWEQLGPMGRVFLPEARPIIEASDGIALVANTADAFGMSGYVIWEEL